MDHYQSTNFGVVKNDFNAILVMRAFQNSLFVIDKCAPFTFKQITTEKKV